jgi:hypothetical protein
VGCGCYGESKDNEGRRRRWKMSSRIDRRDFAKRFERGKLGFTGDVLQVICVFGRHQKFAKLLKLITVGA